MTSKNKCLFAALYSLLIVACFICSSESASCCMKYTKRKLPCRPIQGYSIQTINGSCDINAIIFHLRGSFICADPFKSWTVRGMKCVDERKGKQKDRILIKKRMSHGN